MASRINSIVEEIFQVCPTPLKQRVTEFKNDYLTLQAHNTTLNALNQELVKRKADGRKKATKKHCGEARILAIEAVKKLARQREDKEAEEQRAKQGGRH